MSALSPAALDFVLSKYQMADPLNPEVDLNIMQNLPANMTDERRSKTYVRIFWKYVRTLGERSPPHLAQ
jgi:hypothetical protein